MGATDREIKKDLKCLKIDKKEHKIDKKHILPEAVKVITRLNSFGYQGYVVGGAVRDLLMGREPKDFDVVTDAVPNQLRRIFKNARVIGRRFRLVHVYFSGCIVETATFRAESNSDSQDSLTEKDNIYGEIEDDVIRRDFSLNALYYDPASEVILDFVDGYKDIQSKIIRTLKDEKISFLEDPVRMLRAVKYSVLLDCHLSDITKKNIRKYGKEILKCSSSRLYEEFNKIFKSGMASKVFKELHNLKLLKHLIPFFYSELSKKTGNDLLSEMMKFEKNINKTDFFEYETYWLIMIKRILDSKIINDNSENLLDSIKIILDKNLIPVNVPKKVIEDISKAYYIFIKYSTIDQIEKIKKYKLQNSFNIALKLFNLYCEDQEIIKIISSFNFTKKISKDVVVAKKHQSNINYKNKRCVETKKTILRMAVTENIRGIL
ncbi:MAG: hypothetical protein A2015_04430 [Spirochaetes bacterium GWF1_31_7]|nr:MAG: hypothetical protein A2Y30_16840 [Spirochaetes bacterium GWE1_32_154]OHD51599.1 MAG: hypothetical protein A2Y29_07585 [Spirochaetes bacterium GWE2_31_10]OHD52967.1 MAG: hypothetical protein A2015_04430 [Spirochaetes bacterium GWF1_31_7]OHD73723.1 MAG: hypothetical protein A2355_18030 [Spirochaetes bacterium RIFOXYB1_FULL_32_8]HBD93711.1 hypothetical protein [Spirochaetia bacterium]